jgi:non-ribosomal peptide synthase protein (TIGR01720 family)
VAKARQQGINFAVKDVFNYPTIASLAINAQTEINTLVIQPQQDIVTGDIPLTPIQHWFFEENLANCNHYNQATLLQMRGAIDFSLLKKAFEFLVTHHDALRCRYIKDVTGVWKQTSLTEEDIASIWTTIDLSNCGIVELSVSIEQESNILQQSLSIETGPLCKIALFNCGIKAPARLLLVIHHLVVDGVSWRILLEDLEHVYEVLKNNKTLSSPLKTHSYQQWSYALTSYAKSKELAQQIPYWQKIQESTRPLPIDFDKGCIISSTQAIVLSLTKEETTALLQKAPKAYRTQINDILLTALTLAIGDWTKDYNLSLSLEGHGREDIIKDIDLSRTIGWFTSIFPVYLKIDNPDDLGEAIKTVKETLRHIPDKGIGYGILKYLTLEKPLLPFISGSGATVSVPSIDPSLSFNYLGQWDNTLSQEGLFEFAQESSGCSIARENTSSYYLNINSEVRGEVFSVYFDYSSNHYNEQTVDKVSKAFISRLRQIIEHCTSDNVFGYTASDFTLNNLERSKIDKRIKIIEES